MQLTWYAPLPPLVEAPAPAGVVLRAATVADVPALGPVYLGAYPPGTAGADVDEAVADLGLAFAGGYGPLLAGACLVALPAAVAGEPARPLGACLTVDPAPWDDVLPGPFVIDLFVDSTVRRTGIGRALIVAAASTRAVGRGCGQPVVPR